MIILTGKSKKGKARVKQFGSEWTVCGTGDLGILVASINADHQGSKDLRWVNAAGDPDFTVEVR